MAVIAIDVGGSSFKVALVDAGIVLRLERTPHTSSAHDLDRLASLVRSWLDAAETEVTAVGIAAPGIVDVEHGTMTSAHEKVGYLVGKDLVRWARTQFDLTAVVENDARAACWGEFVHGAGSGVANLAVLTVGTGVGTAVMINGRLVHGANGHGGILGGHMRIRPAGRRCNCGGRGCVEAEASGWALPRIFRDLPATSPWSGRDDAGFLDVMAAASRGDPVAADIQSHFISAWAVAILNLCQITDPARVVLTGGLMANADEFVADLASQVQDFCWDRSTAPEISVAKDVWASATLGIADLAEHAKHIEKRTHS